MAHEDWDFPSVVVISFSDDRGWTGATDTRCRRREGILETVAVRGVKVKTAGSFSVDDSIKCYHDGGSQH